MKTVLSTALFLGLLASPLTAQARDYYSIPISISFYYSSPEESALKLGSYSGTVKSSSDGKFKSLTLDGQEVPFETLELSSSYIPWHHCRNPFKGFICSSVAELSLTLSKETTMKLMRGANHSIWRSRKIKKAAAALMERYAANPAIDASLGISIQQRDITYATQYSSSTLELSDDVSPESLMVYARVRVELDVH